MRSFCLVSILLFLLPVGSDASSDGFNYGVQFRTAAGLQGELPFWMYANRQDELDPDSFNAATNLFGSWSRSLGRGFTLSAGSNLLLRGSRSSDFRFQEAYLKLEYGGFYLYGGRKKDYQRYGMVNHNLSLGTMDWSPNARPMKKVTFATDGHRAVPWTGDYLFYDAHISQGIMDDNDTRFIQDVLMHSKSLYIRIFDEDHWITINGGLSHYVMWGGYNPEDGDVPQGIREFFEVFISRAGDRETMFEDIIGTGFLKNRYQNHGGIYDFALKFNLENYNLAVTRQFMLEDTPNYRFAAPWDGIWGLQVNRNGPGTDLVESFVYEHVNTLDQLSSNPKRNGRTANYYGHTTYRGGWIYHGNVIGTPLYFTKDAGEHHRIANNELIAHHIGLHGYLDDNLSYRMLGTYSRNYGDQDAGNFPRKDQYSLMLEFETALRDNLTLNTTFAADTGDLYSENFGAMLGLRWVN